MVWKQFPTEEISLSGSEVRFDPVTVNIGEQKEMHFQAISKIAGEHTIRISYQNDTMTRPLLIEGDAFFYDDKQTRNDCQESPEPVQQKPLATTPDAGPSLEPVLR